MTFMIEGGFAMWPMVLVAAAALALEARGRTPGHPSLVGAVASVALGMLGYALGMRNVVAYVEAAAEADKLVSFGIGSREAGNNLILGGAIGVVLVLVHVVRRRG
jgi:hypothetical protein